MGRYYRGDIEGKFWFGVQSSDDADFFGGQSAEPSELDYSFDETELPTVEVGIKECLEELGENKEKLDTYFKANSSYQDKMLSDYLAIEENKLNTVLEWYARLKLGEKIRDCLKETGTCSFTAEL